MAAPVIATTDMRLKKDAKNGKQNNTGADLIGYLKTNIMSEDRHCQENVGNVTKHNRRILLAIRIERRGARRDNSGNNQERWIPCQLKARGTRKSYSQLQMIANAYKFEVETASAATESIEGPLPTAAAAAAADVIVVATSVVGSSASVCISVPSVAAPVALAALPSSEALPVAVAVAVAVADSVRISSASLASAASGDRACSVPDVSIRSP
jgi:hypothetical protein